MEGGLPRQEREISEGENSTGTDPAAGGDATQ